MEENVINVHISGLDVSFKNFKFTTNNCVKHHCCNIIQGKKQRYLNWEKCPKFILNVVSLKKEQAYFQFDEENINSCSDVERKFQKFSKALQNKRNKYQVHIANKNNWNKVLI